MRLARVVGYDALAKVFENGVERRRMLGWVGVEQFARAASIQRAIRRLVAQAGKMLGDEIGHLPAHLLHRRVVELKRQR